MQNQSQCWREAAQNNPARTKKRKRLTGDSANYLALVIFAVLLGLTASRVAVGAPVIDGVISTDEYGKHINGDNQQTVTGGTWYMTYDAEYLYIAFSGTPLGRYKTAVMMVNNDRADYNDLPDYGSFTAPAFNGSQITTIGQRSDTAIYFKDNGTVEIARSAGYNQWTARQDATSQLSFASSGGSLTRTYELQIPWYLIDFESVPINPVFKPTYLGHLEYIIDTSGMVTAQSPTTNPSGSTDNYTSWLYTYYVSNTNSTVNLPFGNVVTWDVCENFGTVTSQATGLPIQNASVKFFSLFSELYAVPPTDANGYYYRLLPATYAAGITAAGYQGRYFSSGQCNGPLNYQLQP